MSGGFINRLFSLFKKESKSKLIKDLEKEHKVLLKMYENIEKTVAEKDYDKVLKLLSEFFYKYKKHVLMEDNYLYVKLLKKYEGYESIVNFIKETKDELDVMTQMLEKFLLVYSSKDVIEQKLNEFTHDFIKLGQALKERIEFEESKLYILY
jgi:regulator of sigma D